MSIHRRGKPPVEVPPRYLDESDYKRMTGCALIAAGIVLFVLVIIVSGIKGV